MRSVPATDARVDKRASWPPAERNLSASSNQTMMSGVSNSTTPVPSPVPSQSSTPAVPNMYLQTAAGASSNAVRFQPASLLTSTVGLANHGPPPSAPQYFQDSLQALQSLQRSSVPITSDIVRTSDLVRPRSVTPERSLTPQG